MANPEPVNQLIGEVEQMVPTQRIKTYAHLALIIMALFFWIGCVAGTSSFRRSQNVTDTFENHRVLPDYRYYFSGNEYKPTAVVGIHKDYNLSSPHWHSRELNEKQLAKWVDRILNQPGAEYNVFPNGAYILNPEGDRIGMWYSVWRLPILTFKSGKEIVISDPMTVFPPENRGEDTFEDREIRIRR